MRRTHTSRTISGSMRCRRSSSLSSLQHLPSCRLLLSHFSWSGGDAALCGGSSDHTSGFGSVAGSPLREMGIAASLLISADIVERKRGRASKIVDKHLK